MFISLPCAKLLAWASYEQGSAIFVPKKSPPEMAIKKPSRYYIAYNI
jgi:hypothetical protein